MCARRGGSNPYPGISWALSPPTPLQGDTDASLSKWQSTFSAVWTYLKMFRGATVSNKWLSNGQRAPGFCASSSVQHKQQTIVRLFAIYMAQRRDPRSSGHLLPCSKSLWHWWPLLHRPLMVLWAGLMQNVYFILLGQKIFFLNVTRKSHCISIHDHNLSISVLLGIKAAQLPLKAGPFDLNKISSL